MLVFDAGVLSLVFLVFFLVMGVLVGFYQIAK